MVSITHVLSASSLAPSQLSWAASRQGTEEWPERSPRGDGIGPEGRPAGCTLGWQGRKAPCGLRSRGRGGQAAIRGRLTWEKISTRCPSSRSFLSIFCSSMSFPDDLTRELPS